PVFSNFGELKMPMALDTRSPQAVMFGGLGRGIKNRAFGLATLGRACRHLGIQRMVNIGYNISEKELGCNGLAVENHKPLSLLEARRVLCGSRVGLLDYFDGYLGKSGIFAAFCSHGVAPVMLLPNASAPDGLHPEQQFLAATKLEQTVSMA